MKKPARSKQSRRRLLIASGVTVAIVATAVVAFGLTARDRAPRPAFEGLIPTSAGLVMSLGAEEADWALVSAFDAPLALGSLSLAEAPTGLTALGFSLSDASDGAPNREVYLETTSSDAAATVVEWMADGQGADQRVVGTSGATVLVTAPTEAGIEAAEGFASRGAEGAGMADLLQDRPAGASGLWLDFDRLREAIQGSTDQEQVEAVSQLGTDLLGLEAGTRWLGSSRDGVVFSGDYLSGGFDAELLSPVAAMNEALGNQMRPDASPTERVVGAALDGIGVRYATTAVDLDAAGFEQEQGEAIPDALPQGEVMAVIGLSTWIASLSGETPQGEGIAALGVSLTGRGMSATLRLNPTPYVLPEAESVPTLDEAPTLAVEPPASSEAPVEPGLEEGAPAPKLVAPEAPPAAPAIEAPEPLTEDEPGDTASEFPSMGATIPPGFGAGG